MGRRDVEPLTALISSTECGTNQAPYGIYQHQFMIEIPVLLTWAACLPVHLQSAEQRIRHTLEGLDG